MDGKTIVVAVKSLTSADLEGEVVVLDMESGQYYGLNEVGARILELVQEPQSVEAIVEALSKEYDVEKSRLEQDVVGFLQDMESHRIIEVHETAA